MPSMADTVDFGLPSESYNKKFLNTIKDGKLIQVLAPELRLFRSGTKSKGRYYVVNSRRDLITYYVDYARISKPVSGVVQIRVWKCLFHNGSLPAGFATHMVFSVFLPEYGKVVSDEIQTRDGRKFWIALMTTALARGLRVSLLNTQDNKEVDIPDVDALAVWCNPDGFSSAWGIGTEYQKFRFIIQH